MGIIKRKPYYFSDSSIAVDTIIADCMAIPCLIMELSSVIASIVTKGAIPEIYGLLYVCALILSISGFTFACFGMKAQEGGVRGKRTSVFLNVLSFVVIVAFMIMGL